MNKTYDPKLVEEKIYRMWEAGGYFTPKIDQSKKPFSIILPLPNANDPMHMGHALFTVQDIMIRYHRMLGEPTLWLPGGDHAGIETQYVFEKKLAKEGKSRFQFDRDTLYKMIEEFVEKNKSVNRDQMKRLGFSLDWTRYHYSLEPKIVETVLETFRKLIADGLAYRDDRLVNYCTHDGTAFSDLEVKYIDRVDPLYYMKYGPFILATVRPETKFGDTAIAVNPKDKRYQKWIGKEIEVKGLRGKFKIKVIADEAIDPKFGTGVAKVTPSHDFTDFEIAKRHNLEFKQIIGLDGRLTTLAGPYAGMKVAAARAKVVEDLQAKGLIDHIDENYTHSVAVCYRCGTTLEPLPMPQWYVKMKPLAKPAIQAVKAEKTKIVPLKRFEKLYFDWLTNIKDWNISRQIVWGPRIPAWYSIDENSNLNVTFIDKNGQKQSGKISVLLGKSLEPIDKPPSTLLTTAESITVGVYPAFNLKEIKAGLQQLAAPIGSKYVISISSPGENYLQETDTFDTWFLSSQWPLTTLGFPDSEDFKYFYPTSVLDTMWDILFFWVARMMMMGLYRTGEVPFKIVHLHSRVVDAHGQKMAKSRGNVMNPIELVDKYGADALRFALIFGAGPGSDIAISDDKVRGMRNFANKLWNIGRFIQMSIQQFNNLTMKQLPFYDEEMHQGLTNPNDKRIISELNMLIASVTKNLNNYRFSDAAQQIYDFTWHTLADIHLEKNKERFNNGDQQALSVLLHVFHTILKLLHPFMPFITEEIWGLLPRKYSEPLIVSRWPKKVVNTTLKTHQLV